MKITQHLRIFGRVQGVFYRESMSQQAQSLGVTGWVRNCSDGTVEAVVQGEPDAVGQIVEWAWSGPAAARVELVEITAGSGEYASFERRNSV